MNYDDENEWTCEYNTYCSGLIFTNCYVVQPGPPQPTWRDWLRALFHGRVEFAEGAPDEVARCLYGPHVEERLT